MCIRDRAYETIDTIEHIHHHYEDAKQKRDLADAHKKFFAELKDLPHIEVVTISELADKFPTRKVKPPEQSSWSTSKEDLSKKNYYPLWKDAGNRIHQLQWEHINICFELADEAMTLENNTREGKQFAIIARGLLDRAVHSCQFWWANKNHGMWDVNMINKGLIQQEEAEINAYKSIKLSSVDDDIKRKFYHKVAAARDIANKIRDQLIA